MTATIYEYETQSKYTELLYMFLCVNQKNE